jgi:protein-disulfide isomerase
VLRVLVLALAVAAAPLPAFAADPPPAQANLNLKASIQKVVAKEVGNVKPSSVARSQQSSGGTTTDLSSGSFFKSPAGIITLVVTAVGVGFALRSTSKDRISVEAIK